MPAELVPMTVNDQAGLYRSLLSGRRMLVVLDNARDAEQVRPLLPGSPGCLVVVTSRNQLSGLVAAEGAHPLSLDLLPVGEARELLARRLGRQRVETEPEAVERSSPSAPGYPWHWRSRPPAPPSIPVSRSPSSPTNCTMPAAGWTRSTAMTRRRR